MNGKTNHNINYTAADIQKYLEGKLPPSEMHAIENAALNDDFLADAIEGMEAYNINKLRDFSTDVEKLKSIIKNKRGNKYIAVLWKAAAVIAVVATIIALTFNQYKSVKEIEVLAIKNTEPKEEKEAIMPSAILTDTVKENNTSGNTTISKSLPRQAREIPSPTSVHIEKSKIATDSFAPVESSKKLKSTYAPPEIRRALEGKIQGISIKDEVDQYQKTFSGIVKDEKGTPVVGAIVLIQGTSNGTVTDEHGSFEIKKDGKDSTLNILVNSIGFNDAEKKIFLNNPSGNNIILNYGYSAGLDDVIVTGYGRPSGKRKAEHGNDIVFENPDNAKPVTGWKNFKKYLQENKRVDSLQENVKGEVIVTFQVDDKGIPYNFSIEKSLSPFYDQEALRLIKDGPLWKLKNSKTAKLSVHINF